MPLSEQFVESVLMEEESVDGAEGPMTERTEGRTTRPWNRPKTTVRQKTLKKVWKTCAEEKLQKKRARKVVRPPLVTAPPM